jgi:hypothetical protein
LLVCQSNGQSTTEVPKSPGEVKREGFFKRLFRAYEQDWKGTADPGPEAPRRIPPAPLDSPPFPNADWSYGGAPVIGAPDTSVYPLMQALYDGPSGEAWKRSRVKIYGWLEPGFNFSTSKKIVFPMSYLIYANHIALDQAVLRIERVPDTVQTDRVDWGFNLTNFFGTDYRFTTSKGYFSQQLLKFNRQYGYDPTLAYVDLYIPHVAKGLNLRVGRYISIPDIEAQLAPSNYTYTHSLLFTTDPFTQTGILGTVKLNDRWLVQAGLQASNDTAPWVSDAKPALTACVGYTFNQGNDFLYPCVNGINNGKYAFNNVQHFVLTHYHKFNQSWHTATEAWYMFERDVPAVGGPITPTPGGNPAFCGPGEIRCFADEWSLANYVLKQFSKTNYLSIRNEVLADLKGQRTGFKTTYSEHELMWGHWIGNTVLFRPGIRFEHSYGVSAYDSGTEQTQFSFAMDVVFRY